MRFIVACNVVELATRHFGEMKENARHGKWK